MTGSHRLPENVIRIPGSAPPRVARKRKSGLVLVTNVLIQLSMAVVLFALFLARRPADFEPFRFFVYYSPRAFLALPFLVLLPASLMLRQRCLSIESLLGLILVCGPLMDFHWGGLKARPAATADSGGEVLRVLTYNIGVESFDIEGLMKYLDEMKIDVLLIQEDAELTRFVGTLVGKKGWNANPRNTVFTKWPILAYSVDLPHEVGGEKLYQSEVHYARVRKGDIEFLIGSAHAPSVRSSFYKYMEHFDYEDLRKVQIWQKRQIERIAGSMDQSGTLPLVLGGDFNSPPRSSLISPIEKRYLDVFAEIGVGYGYTYPSAWPWLRLDRFYVSTAWKPLKCFVAPDFGSDHRPVFVELQLESTGKATNDVVTRPSNTRNSARE